MTAKKAISDLQILVIDDNQQTVRLLSMMLRDMGVKKVLTAQDSLSGWDILVAAGKGAIDGIICD
ncbi:MAG: hypothetical protein FD153_1410 [Rhodospirillaceae bacterium]|nr:MAG: hypothetical protein FD153_1410 [Rhodospirillaceae bacterium]